MNLKFYGPIYSCSGYARIRHLIAELSESMNIQIVPFEVYDDVDFKDIGLLKGLENNKVSKPFVAISVGIPLQFKIDEEAEYNIGYTMFEATALPNVWKEFCNKMDEIWVPSNYNYNMFNIAGVNNVHYVPYGVDLELFKKQQVDKDSNFTFLSIGTFIDRKGWDILLKAYVEEFRPDEKVKLLLKLDGTNKYAEKEIVTILDDYMNEGIPRISVCNKKVDDEKMPDFYSMADCFVLPTRGEAFGLPLLESIACELPVITCDNGGHRDFLTDQNSWFIKSELQQISSRLGKINTYYRNLWFYEPDINHLKKIMRTVFEDQNEYKKKIDSLKQQDISSYDYKKVAKRVKNRLKQIKDKLCV